jgi:hypothetical protein
MATVGRHRHGASLEPWPKVKPIMKKSIKSDYLAI